MFGLSLRPLLDNTQHSQERERERERERETHARAHAHTHTHTHFFIYLLSMLHHPEVTLHTIIHTYIHTSIHAPGGIRTRNPSKRATANPRLRPRGHRDRRHTSYPIYFIYTDYSIYSLINSNITTQCLKTFKYFQIFGRHCRPLCQNIIASPKPDTFRS